MLGRRVLGRLVGLSVMFCVTSAAGKEGTFAQWEALLAAGQQFNRTLTMRELTKASVNAQYDGDVPESAAELGLHAARLLHKASVPRGRGAPELLAGHLGDLAGNVDAKESTKRLNLGGRLNGRQKLQVAKGLARTQVKILLATFGRSTFEKAIRATSRADRELIKTHGLLRPRKASARSRSNH